LPVLEKLDAYDTKNLVSLSFSPNNKNLKIIDLSDSNVKEVTGLKRKDIDIYK